MIANAFVGCLFFGTVWSVVEIALASSYWFIYCIMVYYLFIYFIEKYFPDKMLWFVALICVITAIWFLFIYDVPKANLYGGHPIRWLHSFCFMLIGAFLSSNSDKNRPGNNVLDVFLMFVFTVLFYGIFLFSERLVGPLVLIQYLSMFPLFMAMYYFYRVASSQWVSKIYNNKYFHFIIRFIGGLCLEIYLVQGFFITSKYNDYFPLNILAVFIIIVIAAYLTRCLARIISQTFNDAPYDWKKIIALY